jgi:16S rRNA C967 or C1407 C5-methylase (RsmB/RsmF family)
MTCTYALEENEETIAWFLQRFPDFQPQVVPSLEAFQSPFVPWPCYRLWPQSGLGAGAFTTLLHYCPALELP